MILRGAIMVARDGVFSNEELKNSRILKITE